MKQRKDTGARFVNGLVSLIVGKRWYFLVLCLLLFAGLGALAPFVEQAHNVDYFVLQDDPSYQYYQRFKKIFGNDEFFVIAYQQEDLFSAHNLQVLKEITQQIEDLGNVRRVLSLANVDDIVGSEEDFTVRPFLEEIPNDPEQLADLRREAVANPLYVRSLISEDGQTAAIVIFTREHPQDPQYRKHLLAQVERIVAPFGGKKKFHLAGWTVTNLRLTQYMQQDLATFIPITYLLITGVIFLFFRDWRLTLLAVINVSACLCATMGMFKVLGFSINNVTTIVPPLIMALSLADTVHIFSHLRRSVLERHPEPGSALSEVLRKLAGPCFLTSLTTAIGFASLVVSRLEPIRQFAVVSTCGMFLEYFFSFFFLPPLLLLVDPQKIYQDRHRSGLMGRVLDGILFMVTRQRILVLAGSVLLVAFSLFFASQIKVETSLFDYFKKNSPVMQNIKFVEQHLGGVNSLDLCLESSQPDAFKEPRNIRVLDELSQGLKRIPGVDIVLSFADFIKEMNKSFHNEDPAFYRVPESRNLVAQYLLLQDMDQLSDFVNDGYTKCRMSIRISRHSTEEEKEIISEIKRVIAKVSHPGLEIKITGFVPQEVLVTHTIVSSQVKSLAMAAVLIFLVMFLVLRSFALGVMSIVPNAFPLVLNFGLMGAAGISLNASTSLISAVALGIAVDDTIHFLLGYAGERKKGFDSWRSVKQTIYSKGQAIISSSVILAIGFGILICSPFVPSLYFGLLTAIIMLTALFGDLFIAPAMCLLFFSGRVKTGRPRD